MNPKINRSQWKDAETGAIWSHILDLVELGAELKYFWAVGGGLIYD